MSVQWVRLWLDMPNDPKWRAVARRSGQRIGDVIAVYTHMLCQARVADTAGRIDDWDDEDVAAALDLDPGDVQAIREAMQGKVLDGSVLTGWEKRQPSQDESANERKRRQRQSGRHGTSQDVTACHGDVTRDVTEPRARTRATEAEAEAEAEQQQGGVGDDPAQVADTGPSAPAAPAAAGLANGHDKSGPSIEDACRRIQKTWNNPNARGSIAPTVRKWLNWGCDLEHDILPAIQDVMERRGQHDPPNKLTYFDKAIWERYCERLAQPPDDGAANGHDGEPASNDPPWKARLCSYAAEGMWLDAWGPPPGKRGCQAPSELVREIVGGSA